jgi:hypothetical protein
MSLLMWIVAALAFSLCLSYALTAYALSQRRAVKTGLKIPFASFSFETTGREDALPSADKSTQIADQSPERKRFNSKR